MENYKKELEKEAENYVKYHLLPFIKENYPYLLPRIAIGVSGSLVYGEVDEFSDVDINLFIDDFEANEIDLTKFEKEIKRTIDRNIYKHIDVSVISTKKFFIEEENFDLSEALLETAFVIENFRLIHCESGWFSNLKSKVREIFSGYNKHKLLKKVFYYWITSTVGYLLNTKKTLLRKDYITFDVFLNQSIIDLVKFVYLLNGMFFPPQKWFFKILKKAKFLGDIVLNYVTKINKENNKEEKGELYEELLLKISEKINNVTNIKIKRDGITSLKQYFEDTTTSIGLIVVNPQWITNSVKKINNTFSLSAIPNKTKGSQNYFISYDEIHYLLFLGSLNKSFHEKSLNRFLLNFYKEIKRLEEEELIRKIEEREYS